MLITATIFLPQSLIAWRKPRSLSVNGRSAEVTNRTRSACGTNSLVSRSCSRKIALVPGVSTMLMSRRNGTGAAMTSAPEASAVRDGVSPYSRICSRVVVGVTPSSSTRAPTSALTNALLPALNSPMTTRRNRRSSCAIERCSAERSSAGASMRSSACWSLVSQARSSARCCRVRSGRKRLQHDNRECKEWSASYLVMPVRMPFSMR